MTTTTSTSRRSSSSGTPLTVVVTERADGDLHPTRTPPAVLRARQESLGGAPWVMVDQVHGTTVHQVGAHPTHREAAAAIAVRADVVVTTRTDVTIAVWAADCAAVVLAGRSRSRGPVLVGAHAGWRGLAAGVLDVAVAELTRCGADVDRAVLGPTIGPCCYEFGSGDLDAVAAGIGLDAAAIASTTRDGTRSLDVPAAVGAGLARHGIAVERLGACTACDPRWFSHRRGDTERHALVATLGTLDEVGERHDG